MGIYSLDISILVLSGLLLIYYTSNGIKSSGSDKSIYINFKSWLVCKDKDVKEHERLSNF
jgi:hypothetical protein